VTSGPAARWAEALRAAVRGKVQTEVALAGYCTYRIGGPATVFHPADAEDLAGGLRAAAEAGRPVFLLGLGSNVLLPDTGLEGLVVRLGKGLDRIEGDGPRWRLGAGAPAPLVARRTAQAGWAGLHMMVGVPGSVGGGVYMNAGCHGGDWASVVRRVLVLDRAGNDSWLAAAEIPFAYRRSGLEGAIVVETEVELTPGSPAALQNDVTRLFAWRQRGTPFNQPCCGSVFKNPHWPGDPPGPGLRTAGQLIEACGLKGAREGAIEVSPMHANYFVNTGGGLAVQVRRLMGTVASTVRARFGIALDPEVRAVDELGRPIADPGLESEDR